MGPLKLSVKCLVNGHASGRGVEWLNSASGGLCDSVGGGSTATKQIKGERT